MSLAIPLFQGARGTYCVSDSAAGLGSGSQCGSDWQPAAPWDCLLLCMRVIAVRASIPPGCRQLHSEHGNSAEARRSRRHIVNSGRGSAVLPGEGGKENGPCAHLHAASTPGHLNQPGSSAVLRALPKTYTVDTQAAKTREPLGLHRSSVVRTATGPSVSLARKVCVHLLALRPRNPPLPVGNDRPRGTEHTRVASPLLLSARRPRAPGKCFPGAAWPGGALICAGRAFPSPRKRGPREALDAVPCLCSPLQDAHQRAAGGIVAASL